MTLRQRIMGHEGMRNKPYLDTVGKLTIGYGRNLDDIGISDDEAAYLFERDFKKAERLAATFAFYPTLNKARKGVVVEMVFQLGYKGVFRFKKFRRAASAQKWDKAADEMLDSKWHTQTKSRCEELAEIFRTGKESR